MKTLHVFRVENGIGVFTGQTVRVKATSHSALGLQPPEGCEFFEAAQVDHLSQRLDLETRTLVDYQPPAPDALHEWNATRRRWQLREDVAAARAARTVAQAQLVTIDVRRSRALEDLALAPNEQGSDGLMPRQRLQALRSEAEALREVIRKNADPVIETGTSEPTAPAS